jgi:signal transduction histidine kinase
VNPAGERQTQDVAQQSSFVFDVLHKLSQPLTALQCSLEFSLVRDQTCAEFRASIQAAVQNAERLRQSLLLLRELSDADDPGDISMPVPLQELMLELQQDFLPVCESAGGCLTVHCEPVSVRGNGAKLRRAFFYMLECVLRSSERRRLGITVSHRHGKRVEIKMTLSDGRPATALYSETLNHSVGELEIAQRTFRAVGGDLAPEPAGWESGCTVSLRLAD